MRLFIRYFGLELKRSVWVLRKTLVAAVLGAFVIGALAAVLTVFMRNLSEFDLVEVGMVIPEEAQDDRDTMYAVRLLAAMDSVKSVSSFAWYGNEEQALADLRQGKLKTVISLPPYFFEDVDAGINTPAVIYLPEDADGNTRVFVELLKDGVRMLQVAEAGAYAALDVAQQDRPVGTSWTEAGDVVAFSYIKEALTRQRLFRKVMVSAVGTTDYGEFYFVGALVVMLAYSGVFFAHLYQKKNRAFVRQLAVNGLGGPMLSLVRLLVMTLVLWVEALVLYAVGCGLSRLLLYRAFVPDAVAVAGLLALAFSVACYFHILFAIAGGETSGCIVLLAVNTGMVLLSGIAIPSAYLPLGLQGLSARMPMYGWDNFAMEALFGVPDIGRAGILLAVSAAAAIIGGGVLWKNTSHGFFFS